MRTVFLRGGYSPLLERKRWFQKARDFKESGFQWRILSNKHLRGNHLGGNLSVVIFQIQICQGSDLTGENFSGGNLPGANLFGVIFLGIIFWDAIFRGQYSGGNFLVGYLLGRVIEGWGNLLGYNFTGKNFSVTIISLHKSLFLTISLANLARVINSIPKFVIILKF